MKKDRGPWYLLTGIILGAVLGLLYAWLVQPVQYTNTTPASLRSDFKDQYRSLIAIAYMANGDMVRANARLELLKDEDVYHVLAEQAQRTMAEGGIPQEARALGLLAAALGQPLPIDNLGSHTPQITPSGETITASPLGTSGNFSLTPDPSSNVTTAVTVTSSTVGENINTVSPGTPLVTKTSGSIYTPLPTRTATSTPGATFVLESRELVCDPNLGESLIQILALDAADQPVPGVEVVITWESGEDHFFTGLKPELGLGYADFNMTAGTTYTLRLAESGQPIPGLTPSECDSEEGNRYWGAWLLIFSQP